MSQSLKRELTTRKDIEELVNRFYARVMTNELLGPLFAHLDWTVHKPIMHNFWSSMMLGDNSYQGNPLAKHIPLNINKAHFAEWLLLFDQTVNDMFVGTAAEEIKTRANQIAGVFQVKLGLW